MKFRWLLLDCTHYGCMDLIKKHIFLSIGGLYVGFLLIDKFGPRIKSTPVVCLWLVRGGIWQ